MAPKLLAALALVLAASSSAQAANLDVTAAYKMRAGSFSNLDLNSDKSYQNNRAFISNDARLGVAVRKISLETRGLEDVTMDVGVTLRALGATGSTSTLQAPFDRAANNYPSTDFTPFIENAYLKVSHLFGYPTETTFGRQNFKLGTGLLLDDDGAGMTGVTVRGELPWWNIKTEGFIFADRAVQQSAPNSLALFGLSIDLPSEGLWQLNQLFERDRSQQKIYGCTYEGIGPDGCTVSKALRSFTSLRYNLIYGPIVFDGEVAVQRGAATPTGANPAPNHITYNGNAQVAKAKWKQSLPRLGEGIARLSVARGSGDNPSTKTTDEAFFPSHGHRYNGLERSGFGEFFAATPYDALGTSTSTANGLSDGASGIIVVGAGYTPAAYKGVALDVDYFLYQAERIRSGPRTLGMEWDLRLRYNVQDRFGLSIGAAYFTAGKAMNPATAKAKKYTLEAFGRF
jgi:hypothetical protein